MAAKNRKRKDRKGSALVAVLAFSFIVVLGTTAMISFGVQRRLESARLTIYNAELAMAENVLNSLVAQFEFAGTGNARQILGTAQGLEGFLTNPNGLLEALTQDGLLEGFDGFNVTAAIEQVLERDPNRLVDQDLINEIGTLAEWEGFNIDVASYRIVAGARATPDSNLAFSGVLRRPGVYVAKNITFYRIPLLAYAIFYHNALELDAGQQIDVYGRVHTNSDWYLTTSSTANYHSAATIAGRFYGGVYHPGDQRRGRSGSNNINVANRPPSTPGGANNTNLRSLRNTSEISINDGFLSSANYRGQWNDNRQWEYNPRWVDDAARLFNNQIRDESHGITQVRLPLNEQDNPRVVIEPPDPAADNTGDPTLSRLNNKLAYQASVIIETRPGWNNAANFTGQGLGNLNDFVVAYRTFPTMDADGNVEMRTEGPFSVVYSTGTDSNGRPILQTFLDFTRIYDGRERRYVNLLDLDMGRMSTYLNQDTTTVLDNIQFNASGEMVSWNTSAPRFDLNVPGGDDNFAGTDPGIIYVNPLTGGAPAGEHAATRVVNARDLKPVIENSGVDAGDMIGLSIVTEAGLYTKGDVNAPSNDANRIPLLLAGDSIHILSNSFNDANYSAPNLSGGGPNNNAASRTKTNAVFLAGNVPTIHRWIFSEERNRWEQNPEWSSSLGYSGGGENYFRYLENWGGGRTHEFRGSILNLFESRHMTGRWGVGGYYNPPRRDWGWDPSFASGSTPPGMPRSFNVAIGNWSLATADAVVNANRITGVRLDALD